MTRARSELIPESSGGVFHLVTRCVRRERLLERGERREWLCRGWAGWLRHRAARVRAGTRSDPSSADSELGAQLVAMPQCAPPNERTGAQERWTISEGDYLDMVDETARRVATGKRGAMSAEALPLVQRLGIQPEAWIATMQQGGSMLGSALGGPEARRRWAASRGQRWAADKSGLWE